MCHKVIPTFTSFIHQILLSGIIVGTWGEKINEQKAKISLVGEKDWKQISGLYLVLEAIQKDLAGKGNRGYWGGIREGGQDRPEEETFE